MWTNLVFLFKFNENMFKRFWSSLTTSLINLLDFKILNLKILGDLRYQLTLARPGYSIHLIYLVINTVDPLINLRIAFLALILYLPPFVKEVFKTLFVSKNYMVTFFEFWQKVSRETLCFLQKKAFNKVFFKSINRLLRKSKS